MNTSQLKRMQMDKGFVAALDQSGGSTPKALRQYGIAESAYANDEEMYQLVHAMRTRVMASPVFTSEYILGVILFENTMHRDIGGLPTADFLWQRKGIVPFLKVDKGLAERASGVQLMQPIPGLAALLETAVAKNIFGTKMRSVIFEADRTGVSKVVKQQFDLAKQISAAGLVPIVEPEVDIKSPSKAAAEILLKEAIRAELSALPADARIMLKLTIPSQNDFYADLMANPHIVRIVALSGGYSRDEANRRLSGNHGLIASFSRALLEGLSAGQSDAEFNQTLGASIKEIYQASVT